MGVSPPTMLRRSPLPADYLGNRPGDALSSLPFVLVYELEGRNGALEHPLICRARRELLHHKAWPQGDFHQGIIRVRACPFNRDLIRKSSDERQHGDARAKDEKRA